MSYRWSDIFCLPTQRSLLAARVTLVFTMTHVMNKKVTDYKSKPRILQKQKIKSSIDLDLIVDSIFENKKGNISTFHLICFYQYDLLYGYISLYIIWWNKHLIYWIAEFWITHIYLTSFPGSSSFKRNNGPSIKKTNDE